MSAPRLPKVVEHDASAERVRHALSKTTPLWSGGELEVATTSLRAPLRRALTSAHAASRVTRGLELVEKQLSAEAQGMESADQRSGASRGQRVSRLILVTRDAAERMDRRVETLCRRHAGRVLAIRIDCDGGELGALLFGAGSVAKLLMLDHKDAVADALLALVVD